MSTYSKKAGQLLAVQHVATEESYIAEVISEEPLQLKFEEEGPFTKVDARDCIILEDVTSALQQGEEKIQSIVRLADEMGNPFISGLKTLGILDGRRRQLRIHEAA